MEHSSNPGKYLDEAPMSAKQIAVVGITLLLTALDGFDLLSISFAAPGILAEWGISRSALGIVLSMELIGMGIGSVVMGALADARGRRATVMLCLVFMALGMYFSIYANNVTELSFYRVLTGLGIGGMLASTNAIAAEVSNLKNRKLCISLMVVGFSFGGIFGGMISSLLLADSGWRSVFLLGASATSVMIPIVYFFMPESVPWLAQKRPKNVLKRINRSLSQLQHKLVVSQLDSAEQSKPTGSITDIFGKTMRANTLLISAIYVCHTVTFYFVLKWVPTIVMQMGFSPSLSAGVLVWASIGGLIGALLFGALALKINLKILLTSSLLLASLAIILFGHTPSQINSLSFFAALAGFFCQASVVGMYAAMAIVFPADLRAFGTGFALSVGRAGAILSPIIVGFLFSANLSLPQVAMIMACGSAMAAIATLFLKLQPLAPAE